VEDNLIFTPREAEFLKALVEREVEFMIVGLAAATLQGASVVTHDIDLWFKEISDKRIKAAAKAVGGSLILPFAENPPTFAGKAVELFDVTLNPSGLADFDSELAHTIEISLYDVLVRVLRLERIIVNKRAANRPKDKLALPVLEDTLKLLQARGER